MAMNRINLICLGVRDMERSIEFYRSIGFKAPVTDGVPPIIFFNNQGTKLELFPIDALASDIDSKNPPEINTGGFSGITLAVNMGSEREVDDFMNTVSENGGTVAKIPQKTFWGGYSGYFRDPDGYYWEVAYGPSWEFDDNGMLIIG